MRAVLRFLTSRASRPAASLLHGAEKVIAQRIPSAGNDSRMGRSTGASSRLDAWESYLASMHGGDADSGKIQASGAWLRVARERYEVSRSIFAMLPPQVLTAVRVGAQLWAARSLQRGKPVHLSSGSKLIAVFDTRNAKVFLRPDATALELEVLHSTLMPESAAGKPSGFIETYLWDVIWQYGLHDPDALSELPGEVAFRPLQLRRLPPVRPDLLEVRHTTLLRYLLRDTPNFEQLHALSGIPEHLLCQDLAALVMTRAVRPL